MLPLLDCYSILRLHEVPRYSFLYCTKVPSTHLDLLFTPAPQVSPSGERLRVTSLERDDEAVVTCSAENDAGRDALNYTIQVLGQ